jgi:hypothetical protein
MLTIETHETKEKFEIPNTWEELNQAKFIKIIDLILTYLNTDMSYETFQSFLFIRLSDYEESIELKYRKKKGEYNIADNVYEQLYILSEQTQFVFKPNTKQLNLNFAKNLIPEFTFRSKKYTGYKFSIENNMLFTDFTAEQFCNAYELYTAYAKSGNVLYLDMLINVLYRNKKALTKSIDLPTEAKRTHKLDFRIKYGVFLCFQAIMTWLIDKSTYSLLWTRTDDEIHSKINLGMGSTIYSMAKTGYGSIIEVNNMNLVDFLSVQLSERIEYVRTLKQMEKSDEEIMKETGLNENQLKLIL